MNTIDPDRPEPAASSTDRPEVDRQPPQPLSLNASERLLTPPSSQRDAPLPNSSPCGDDGDRVWHVHVTVKVEPITVNLVSDLGAHPHSSPAALPCETSSPGGEALSATAREQVVAALVQEIVQQVAEQVATQTVSRLGVPATTTSTPAAGADPSRLSSVTSAPAPAGPPATALEDRAERTPAHQVPEPCSGAPRVAATTWSGTGRLTGLVHGVPVPTEVEQAYGCWHALYHLADGLAESADLAGSPVQESVRQLFLNAYNELLLKHWQELGAHLNAARKQYAASPPGEEPRPPRAWGQDLVSAYRHFREADIFDYCLDAFEAECRKTTGVVTRDIGRVLDAAATALGLRRIVITPRETFDPSRHQQPPGQTGGPHPKGALIVDRVVASGYVDPRSGTVVRRATVTICGTADYSD